MGGIAPPIYYQGTKIDLIFKSNRVEGEKIHISLFSTIPGIFASIGLLIWLVRMQRILLHSEGGGRKGGHLLLPEWIEALVTQCAVESHPLLILLC